MPPKPSIWPKLFWRAAMVTVPLALYCGCAPVRHVVDTTAGAAYSMTVEEINSPPPVDPPPVADDLGGGTSIAIPAPGY
jgi:hypothetical protein